MWKFRLSDTLNTKASNFAVLYIVDIQIMRK